MNRADEPEDSLQVLCRMIDYIRVEATRLHLSEVALLLARAKDTARIEHDRQSFRTELPPESGRAQ